MITSDGRGAIELACTCTTVPSGIETRAVPFCWSSKRAAIFPCIS